MSLINLIEQFYKYCSEKNPEAPKSAPFGEYAWTKHRKGLPDEPETELEKQVYKDIKLHFASKRTGLPKLTVRVLMKILKNKWYESIIHPPKHETLYRGRKLSKKELIDLIGDNFEDNGSIDFNKSIKIENGHSTSWTFKKSVSKDFSGNYGKAKSGYAVTLIAKLKDNPYRFIAGPGGLYNVEGLSRWHLEKETVGLEPIIIEKIEWEKI